MELLGAQLKRRRAGRLRERRAGQDDDREESDEPYHDNYLAMAAGDCEPRRAPVGAPIASASAALHTSRQFGAVGENEQERGNAKCRRRVLASPIARIAAALRLEPDRLRSARRGGAGGFATARFCQD